MDNGALNMGSVSRLEFSGPADEGVTVRICIEQGVIVVYGSYTIPNPTAALHDFSEILSAADGELTPVSCFTKSATLDDIMGGSEEEGCTLCDAPLPRRKKRQAEEEEEATVTVYVTIEGASESENQFSVDSTTGTRFGKYSPCLSKFH